MRAAAIGAMLVIGGLGCQLETGAEIPGIPYAPEGPTTHDAAVEDASDDGETRADGGVVPPEPDAEAPRADAAPTEPADGGPADTGAVEDASEADTGSSGPAPSCDEVYGAADGYQLCMEAEEECVFYVRLREGRSCDDVCTSGTEPGVCLRVEENLNSAAHRCTPTGGDDEECDDHDAEDNICVCSRPQ